jgi:hypothetical protein
MEYLIEACTDFTYGNIVQCAGTDPTPWSGFHSVQQQGCNTGSS